jgi:hypothetical protein
MDEDRNDAQDQLSAKQHEAILALLSEPSIQNSAVKVGVTEKTIRRWLDQPTFAAEYRKAKRDAYTQAIGVVQRYATTAVNTVLRVMTDTASPPNARISAASALLRLGRQGIELDDLAARVDALEQAARSEQNKGNDQWRSRNG